MGEDIFDFDCDLWLEVVKKLENLMCYCFIFLDKKSEVMECMLKSRGVIWVLWGEIVF